MYEERIEVRRGSRASLLSALLATLGWRGILALAAAGALVVALVVVIGAVFLLAFPILAVAGLVAGWLGRRRERHGPVDALHVEVRHETVEIEPERIEILPPRRRR